MERILYKRLKNIVAKPVHVPKLYHSNHTSPSIFILFQAIKLVAGGTLAVYVTRIIIPEFNVLIK